MHAETQSEHIALIKQDELLAVIENDEPMWAIISEGQTYGIQEKNCPSIRAFAKQLLDE